MFLYIMLAYLMLLAALFNAVCLYIYFLPLTFTNAFCFHTLSWVNNVEHIGHVFRMLVSGYRG